MTTREARGIAAVDSEEESIAGYLQRHPEFFDELSDFFEDLERIESIAAPLRDIAAADDASARAETAWRIQQQLIA